MRQRNALTEGLARTVVLSLAGLALLVVLPADAFGDSPLLSLGAARLTPAERPTTSKRPGLARTTSSACVPIDPVEPRTRTRRIEPAYRRLAIRKPRAACRIALALTSALRTATPGAARSAVPPVALCAAAILEYQSGTGGGG